jgi:hypothetical protein
MTKLQVKFELSTCAIKPESAKLTGGFPEQIVIHTYSEFRKY